MSNHGSFDWQIEGQFLREMLNANIGHKCTSDTFKIDNLQFRLEAYPNGDGRGRYGSFLFFLRLTPWPSDIETIRLCQTLYCRQTMVSHTGISTFAENSNAKGWPNRTMLLSDLKVFHCINIGVSINLLHVTNKLLSLHHNYQVDNIQKQ